MSPTTPYSTMLLCRGERGRILWNLTLLTLESECSTNDIARCGGGQAKRAWEARALAKREITRQKRVRRKTDAIRKRADLAELELLAAIERWENPRAR
jgi:hypothetical protein